MEKLLFITHRTARFGTIEGAVEALKGGCRAIQLRMKNTSEQEVLHTAWELKQLCDQAGADLYIDDYAAVALAVRARGVHLGKHDMPVREARALLGDAFRIGGTANTQEDVERLEEQGVDYIGLGPYRFTETKANLSPVLGLEGYRRIKSTKPVIAIGGIEIADIKSLMQTGIAGIAMSGAILRAANPEEETKRILQCII